LATARKKDCSVGRVTKTKDRKKMKNYLKKFENLTIMGYPQNNEPSMRSLGDMGKW